MERQWYEFTDNGCFSNNGTNFGAGVEMYSFTSAHCRPSNHSGSTTRTTTRSRQRCHTLEQSLRSRCITTPTCAKQGIYPLTEQPTYEVDTYVKEGDAYNPVRDYTSEIERCQRQGRGTAGTSPGTRSRRGGRQRRRILSRFATELTKISCGCFLVGGCSFFFCVEYLP